MQEEKELQIVRRAFGMPSFKISAATLASSMAPWVPVDSLVCHGTLADPSCAQHDHSSSLPAFHLLKRIRSHLKLPGEALFCARGLLQPKCLTVYGSRF